MSDQRIPIRDTLERVGRFSAEHRRIVFAVVIALIIVSGGIAALNVQMSLGMELYIEDTSQTNQNWQEIQSDEEFDAGNAVFVMAETEHLHDPSTIKAIDRLDQQYTDADEFTSVMSLADVVRAGNGGELPETQQGVERAINRFETAGGSESLGVAGASDAEQLVTNLQPDSRTTLIIATYGEIDVPASEDQYFGFLPGNEGGVATETIRDETDSTWVPPHVELTVTGSPVFETAAFGLMLPEMITLFAIAFAIIFTVVFLVMRGRLERTWKVFLPVGTAMVALIYMMGMMGVVGFQFNAIMLGVLPIALGLGIDFSLQLHTRYVEERRAGKAPVDAAGDAARTTGNTLLLAMATTSIGLGALLVSNVPPTRQLGATAAFGVIAATMLSLTLLVALLVHFDNEEFERAAAERDPDEEEEDPLFERTVGAIATGITSAPLLVLLLMVAAIGGGAAVYTDVPTTQEMLDYWPDIQEREDLEDLEDVAESPNVMYVVVEGVDTYSPETFQRVSEFETAIEEHDDVNAAFSPATAVRMQRGSIPESRSELTRTLEAMESTETRFMEPPQSNVMPMSDRFATPNKLMIQLYVEDIEGKEVRYLINDVAAEADFQFSTERTSITGKPVINRNVIENVTSGRDPMTILSFSMALLFLAIALRSIRESVLLIVTVAVSAVMLISGTMYLFNIPWNPLTVATGSIALGAGITYGIHVHERYKEELYARGATPAEAIQTAMVMKSRPVVGSGMTTLFGFGVLAISKFPVLANFGVAVALAMGFALLTAFLFLPAAAMALARYTSTYDRS